MPPLVNADSWARVGSRTAVWMFLAVFVVCGVFGFELWPFTGWRLFANARESHQVSWHATASANDGSDAAWAFDAPGLGGTPFLFGRFEALNEPEREALCTQWLGIVRLQNERLEQISIHRVDRDLGRRVGDRSAPPEDRIVYICDENGLNDVQAKATQ